MDEHMFTKEKRKLVNIFNKNKTNIYIFLAMLIFTIIICSNFFNMHFSQDTYAVYSTGWGEYIKTFLFSNRIFSAIAFWIADLLNMSINIAVLISSILAIVFFSIAWFLLYEYVIKLVRKEQDKWFNILIIGISFSILYNFCTFETLIFVEAAVMALAILLAVISSRLYINEKYLKSFLVLLISSCCYQTGTTLFLMLTLVFIAYKYKGNIKEIFKKSLGVFLFWGITMLINLGVSKLFSNYFGASIRKTSMLTFSEIISTIQKYVKELLVNNLNIGFDGWYLIIIILLTILFIIAIFKEKKYFHIFEYIVLLLVSFVVPILPLIVTPIENQYIESRMAMCFGAILGAILLYLVIVLQANKIKILEKVIYITTLFLFITNSIYFVRASSENMATVYIDRNLAKTVLQNIDEYQEKTGNVIDTIGITWDNSPSTYYDGQLHLRSTNARGMVTDFSVIQALEYYSGKDYNAIYQPPDDIKTYFSQYNWDFFSEEQLLFEDNTLWLCLY